MMKSEVRSLKSEVGAATITNPSLETQDPKVIVHERLGELEQKLSTLTNSPQPKTKKAQEKRQAEILESTRSIDNFKAYLSLSIEQKVTDGNQLGIITDLTLSPGGLPEVWVSWYNHVPIPEQPIRLKPEPFFEQLKLGDSVTINDQHPEDAQQTFEVKEFRGEGWIFTTTEQLFHHDFIEESSLISPDRDENLPTQNQGESVLGTVDESASEIVEQSSETSEIIDDNEQEQSTTIVEVVESSNLNDTDELTDEEARDRLHLERKVERAFYEAGKALSEIRDRKLYRSSHKTFEEYCADRFAFKRRHPYQLMNAAQVVDNLMNPNFSDLCANRAQNNNDDQMCTNRAQTQEINNLSTNRAQIDDDQMCTNRAQTETDPMCAVRAQNDDDQMETNRAQILPTSEWQVRPLTKLEPDQQRSAWAKAVEQAGGKVPSGRIVKSIVDQIRERTQVPNPWRVNEVAMIMVKDNPDLRGKGGCWCVITEVHDFSCTVRLWDGNYQVKPENLKELPYSNEQQEKVRKLCDRMTKLYHPEIEETAKAVLASLGRIDRPWLTEFEEKVLRMLEES